MTVQPGVCVRDSHNPRLLGGGYAAAHTLCSVSRSMDTGIEVPIDLEQAGRDLKETTCLTPGQATREQLLKFSYPFLYGDCKYLCLDCWLRSKSTIFQSNRE